MINPNSDFVQCPKCGSVTSEGAAFCPKCGYELNPEVQEEKRRKMEMYSRMMTGCGCLLLGVAVFVLIVKITFWPCIAPVILVLLLLGLIKKVQK